MIYKSIKKYYCFTPSHNLNFNQQMYIIRQNNMRQKWRNFCYYENMCLTKSLPKKACISGCFTGQKWRNLSRWRKFVRWIILSDISEHLLFPSFYSNKCPNLTNFRHNKVFFIFLRGSLHRNSTVKSSYSNSVSFTSWFWINEILSELKNTKLKSNSIVIFKK